MKVIEMKYMCDFCDSPDVAEVAYSERLTFGRRKIVVNDLKKMECSSCGHEYVDESQLARNHMLIEAATSIPGRISIGILRNIRDKWLLTQRTASALFGAGESSFGKWESGQLPSGPTALLLQCATHVPGVVEYLARLQGATLPSCPELADWHGESGEVTGKMIIKRRVERPAYNFVNFGLLDKTHSNYEPTVVELYGEAA